MDKSPEKLSEEKRSDHHRIRNKSKSDSAENPHYNDNNHCKVNGQHPLLRILFNIIPPVTEGKVKNEGN